MAKLSKLLKVHEHLADAAMALANLIAETKTSELLSIVRHVTAAQAELLGLTRTMKKEAKSSKP